MIRLKLLILLVAALPLAGALAQDPPSPPPPEVPVTPPASVGTGAIQNYYAFDAPEGWPTGTYDFMVAEVASGRYILTGTDIPGIIYSSNVLDLSDFYIQIEAYPQSCPGDARFGLAFRLNTDPTSDYYFFYVRCNGLFTAGAVANYTEEILAEGALAGPPTDSGNQMGVLAQGSEIGLFWNGQQIGSFTDNRFTRGELGLSMAPSNEGESPEIAFDTLTVWSLAEDSDAAGATPAIAQDAPTAEPTRPPVTPARQEITIPPERPPDILFDDADQWTAPGGWFIGESELIRSEIIEDNLVITPLKQSSVILSQTVDISDFFARAILQFQTCPPNAIAGMAFRHDLESRSYYLFGVRCSDGAWWVAQAHADEMREIASGQIGGDPPAPGSTHTIAILAQENRFIFYWDGLPIDTFTDEALTAGDIGFHLQNGSLEDLLTIAVGTLEIWEIKPQQPAEAEPAATEGEAPPEESSPAPEEESPQVPVPVSSIHYETTFEGAGNWPTGTFDYATAEVENGHYVVTSTDIVGTFYSLAPAGRNFYAQMEVTPVVCPGNATFGMPFRMSVLDNFYIALMQCDGNWRLSKVSTDDAGTITGNVLINGTLGTPLAVGEAYRFGVMAQGDTLVMYWNGEELGRTNDDTFASGALGLQIRPSAPDYQTLTIRIDNYRVWNLP